MASFAKNAFSLVGIIVLGVLGYYLFMMNGASSLSVGDRERLNEAQLASEQFLKELHALEDIELSDQLFVDARFRSFVDFTKPVESLPVGRENPFAPVE